MSEKRKVGRPLKFESPEMLQQKIDDYFVMCDEKSKPYTVSGLAYFLDTNRETLIQYEKKEKFADTITRAKARIEAFVEESLWQPKIANGVAFSLRNNFGWKDKVEHELGAPGGGPIVLKIELPKPKTEKQPETKLEDYF